MKRIVFSRPYATIASPGFTLIEVVLVVAIVSIFAAMALPRFSNSAMRTRTDLAARKLIADLEWCRLSARSTGTSATLTLSSTGCSYTLTGISQTGNVVSDLTIKLDEAPYSVAYGTVSLLAGAVSTRVITFDPYGIPSAKGTIVLRTAGLSRTITVSSPGGAITLQ